MTTVKELTTLAGIYSEEPSYVSRRVLREGYVSWVHLDKYNPGDGVPVLEIRLASDLNPGDLVERSNYRSLIRDFEDLYSEDVLFDVLYSNGRSLYVQLDAALSDRFETYDSLLEAVENLFEYPLYDELDYSNLASENERECWDSYGRDDLRRELDRAFPDADEVLSEVSDEDLDKAAYDAMEEHNIYPETEGDSVYYRGLYDAETLATIYDRLAVINNPRIRRADNEQMRQV